MKNAHVARIARNLENQIKHWAAFEMIVAILQEFYYSVVWLDSIDCTKALVVPLANCLYICDQRCQRTVWLIKIIFAIQLRLGFERWSEILVHVEGRGSHGWCKWNTKGNCSNYQQFQSHRVNLNPKEVIPNEGDGPPNQACARCLTACHDCHCGGNWRIYLRWDSFNPWSNYLVLDTIQEKSRRIIQNMH